MLLDSFYHEKVNLVNYKNNLLINIIEEILPNGELGWEAVAIAYQGRSNKEMQQDTIDIKKHWMKICVMG